MLQVFAIWIYSLIYMAVRPFYMAYRCQYLVSHFFNSPLFLPNFRKKNLSDLNSVIADQTIKSLAHENKCGELHRGN